MLAILTRSFAVPDSNSPDASPLDDEFDMPTLKGLRVGDTVLGRFKLASCLGRGGMGEVWQAHDSKLEEDIALKLLPRLIHGDDLAVEDLKNETRRGRQLSHPHIVRVFDFYQDDQNVGIAMELVKGENLAKLRAKQQGNIFAVDQIAPWVQQLIEALDYAHRTASVVHRDLKPANLIIDTATSALKIADFGIARCLVESLQRVTLSAQSRGTLCYMSPEQAIGRGANPLDDLYAVGATLYELVAGSPPFYQGDVYTQIQKVPPQPIAQRLAENGIHAQPPPPAWEAAIMRCLAKQRTDRPQSAGEIAEMLGMKGSARAMPYVASPTMPAVPRPQSQGSSDAAPMTSAMTGTVAISTAAPLITVAAGEQTQRSFTDLTRTVGGHTAGGSVASVPVNPDSKKRKSKGRSMLLMIGGAALLGAGSFFGWRATQPTGIATPATGSSPSSNAPASPVVVTDASAPAAPLAHLPPAGEDWNVPSVFFQTINQAIEAAPPGQKIRIGNNRWKERIVLSKAVQLIGSNPDQTIITLDGQVGSPLEIHGVKGVIVEGVTFEHDGTEAVASGPPLVRVEDAQATFRKCVFSKSAGDGILVGDKGNVQAEDCRFEQNTLAGVHASTGSSTKLKAAVFRSNDVGIYSGGDQAKVTNDGGEFQNHSHHGVEVASAGQVTLAGGKITDCAESGFFVHDPGSALTATDVTITKCKEGTKVTDGGAAMLTNCGHDANTIGVVAKNAGPISLTGGRSSGNSLHGVVVEASGKAGSVLISGMTVNHNAGVGLFVGGAEVKPDVVGNDFGPNGQLDVLLRGGAGGSYSKNTLHTGPDFKVFDGGSTPDWHTDNTEKSTPAPAGK